MFDELVKEKLKNYDNVIVSEKQGVNIYSFYFNDIFCVVICGRDYIACGYRGCEGGYLCFDVEHFESLWSEFEQCLLNLIKNSAIA